MKTSLLNHMCFALLTLFVVAGQAQQGVVHIPLNTLGKPASDLVDKEGQFLFLGALKPQFNKNLDLSTINPAENNFWQNSDLGQRTAVDQMLHMQMPSGETTLIYEGFVGAVREVGMYAINVRSSQNLSQPYQLTSGLQVHASLLRAALLRKIGIFQESPKYLNTVKVKFKSIAQMDDFVKQAICVAGPSETAVVCLDIGSQNFITDRNEAEMSLILHGSYLERINPDIPNLKDSITPSNNNTISLYAQSRAYRALVIPFVIGDAGGSLNRYSAQAVLVRNGTAYLNFVFAADFDGYTTGDDARWILRQMAELNDQDWQEIVDAASFHPSFVPIVRAKLIHRFKNMMDTFFSKSEVKSYFKVQLPPLDYSSPDGLVVKGKITKEKIEGSPLRFSDGERKSPFESGDFGKLLKIKAQSSLVDTALGRLSGLLQKSMVSNQKITAVELLSNGGLKDIASTANVLQFGLTASANRIVTTGTYYGSDAAVQMVDSLTIGANAGFFRVLDGLNNINTIFGGGVNVSRNYIHVRPIGSLKDAAKTPIGDLYIPHKLKELTSPLKDGRLTEFLLALQPGEVFTITDSVGSGVQVGISHAIDSLIGFANIGLTVGISADLSKVILRQIQFVRTNEGLQIYVRNQNNKAFGLEFNVNYLINLLKIRSQTTWRDINTKVYVLNYNAARIAQIDKSQDPTIPVDPAKPGSDDFNFSDEEIANAEKAKKFGSQAALALRALLRESSTTALDEALRMQRFDIDHEIKTNELRIKFLWLRATKLKEEHLLTIQKSEVPTLVNGVQVVNEPVQIVTYKKGRLSGKDPFGFGLEVIEGIAGKLLGKNAPKSLTQDSQNPASSPKGKSQWTTVRTDTELTRGDRALPSVAVVENVWSGWSLKREALLKMIESVRVKTDGVDFADFPLVPEGALANVEKIDFYRVTAHMSILPEGLAQIKQLILSPNVSDDPAEYIKYMDRLIDQITKKFAPQNKAQDRTLFGNLVKMIGNGDEALGRQIYMKECRNESNALMELNGSKWTQWAESARLQGTNYACISNWVESLVKLSRKFPANNLRAQNKWLTEVIYLLDQYIPQSAMMNFLGKESFIFYLEVTGFRTGDEDADLPVYVSNVYGEPAKRHPYANGLLNVIADKSKISLSELEQASGGF